MPAKKTTLQAPRGPQAMVPTVMFVCGLALSGIFRRTEWVAIVGIVLMVTACVLGAWFACRQPATTRSSSQKGQGTVTRN